MIELKTGINELCTRVAEPPRYRPGAMQTEETGASKREKTLA